MSPEGTCNDSIEALFRDISTCRACPRLVEWREAVARDKRASFKDETYWGRAVPGFGDASARILVLGLAPAAHGAHRTGRMFTGDRSGDWLYRAMHKCGLANQPSSTDRSDGLELTDAYVAAVVRCAPPDNKPTPIERDTCRGFLTRERALLAQLKVVVCLGSFAYDAACREFAVRPKPKFGHGVVVHAETVTLVCSYHPSQQNTFTGKLTETMLDDVFSVAVRLAQA